MSAATTIPISFELFPPNTVAGLKKLSPTCDALNVFKPDYFSVTFGAGGAQQEKSWHVIDMLLAKHLKVTPHLTCIGLSKETVRAIINRYIRAGIDSIVALRGDLPPDADNSGGELHHANELISFIRAESGKHFHISVAAYPEMHPQSGCAISALANFKRKITAGANAAITQYFFNRDAYFYFIDSCNKAGIDVPIIPGIMPISSVEKLLRFSQVCGAEIPVWLRKRLATYQHDDAALRAFGIDVVTRLCEDLIRAGAPGLHFYTLNQLEPTATIVQHLISTFNLPTSTVKSARV